MKKLLATAITLLVSGVLSAAVPQQQQPTAEELSHNTLPSAPTHQQQSTVAITLKANGTTGFQWYAGNYDHHLLKLVNYHYQAGDSHLVGAPGEAVFTFSIQPDFRTAPQSTQVNFHYLRPWEHSMNPEQKQVTVLSNTDGKVTYHIQDHETDTAPPHSIPPVTDNSLQQQGLYQGLPKTPSGSPEPVTRPQLPTNTETTTHQPLTQSVHQAPIEHGTTYQPQHSTTATHNGGDNWLSLPKTDTHTQQNAQ